MKKNKMMRLASLLLVAVLLTTSVISGTFAKYVTTGSGSDNARVAKFGVAVTGSGSLFDKTYLAADANTPGGDTEDTDGTTLTVEASQKVVAPGTKSAGDGLNFGITGQPEVDVKVTFSMDIKKDVFLKAGNNLPKLTTNKTGIGFKLDEDYYPIVYTLKHGDEVLATGTSKAFKAALADVSVYYDANTDLATATAADNYTLSWEWKFEDESTATAKTLQDNCDTLLGNLAADASIKTPTGQTLKAGTDYSLDVAVDFTVTVTQVD